MSESLRIAVTLTGEALTAFRVLWRAATLASAERTGSPVTTSEVVSEAILAAAKGKR